MQTKEDLLAPFKEWVKEEEDGPPLSDDLATIVDKPITGQEDKDIKAGAEKYRQPNNPSNLTKRGVNKEIWSSLNSGA